MFEKNNLTIALNISYIKERKICAAYISKINWNCEKQIIVLMIRNEENKGWRYLAVKKNLNYYMVYLQKMMVIFIV